jgi:hypothetical protein
LIQYQHQRITEKDTDGEWRKSEMVVPKLLSLPNYIAVALQGYVILDANGMPIREATKN